MKACTRCGRWHTDAEKNVGHYLSCSEVKKYWSNIKRLHMEKSGHLALLKLDEDGRVVCIKCGEDLSSLL
ncbi:MAG: hypothetical protein ACP5VS_18090 [Desulfomonilaceae bacterium]